MSIILDQLEALYTQQEEAIEAWMAARRAVAPPPLTCSVDLRHSGTRLVPVDNNFYPAGFNNLSPAAEGRASRFLAHYMREQFPHAERILIVPENHTRNLAYQDNLAVLKRIVEAAGLQAQIGLLATLKRNGTRITAEEGFTPDIILLNNDCTSGLPPELQHIAQPILPPPWMGWYRRRKSEHFKRYCALAKEFGTAFGLDPWLICAEFRQCGQIDFKAHVGLESLAATVDEVIAVARAKYAEHGIAGEPYAYVKADGGTYGMGIMMVHSGAEILTMNKKARNKMQVVKEGAQVSEVIVQEGVATIDTIKGSPAEPMVYMIDGVPVGGMYRFNPERDTQNNLNAAGMQFTGMCDESEPPDCDRQPVQNCHFHAFGLIAALSALAGGEEMKSMEQQEAA